MVIETEVAGWLKSKPEYNFLASSKQQIDTPEFPIFYKYQDELRGHFRKG